MNAVLQSPTLPMLAAIEEKFNAMEARIKSLEVELLDTKELLVISLKNITQLENAIFKHDDEDEIIRDEDNQPVLNVTIEKPITSENAIIPKTTLEQKATEFALFLKDTVTKTGQPFVSPDRIMHFFKHDLPEPLRMKNIKNPRQFKKDVLEKAKSMFPFITLDRKKNGRRSVRVVYEPKNDTLRLNRMDAYIQSKPT
jgi:hypothetical protein